MDRHEGECPLVALSPTFWTGKARVIVTTTSRIIARTTDPLKEVSESGNVSITQNCSDGR